KHFFNMAQKQPWFVNTLFVITADHTAISEQAIFNNSLGRYRIPLVFYEPNNVKPKIDERVCQQLDIFPTILSYLGIGDVVVTFGNNLLENNIKTFAIQYVNNQHQFIEDILLILFDGEKTTATFNIQTDENLKTLLPTNHKKEE